MRLFSAFIAGAFGTAFVWAMSILGNGNNPFNGACGTQEAVVCAQQWLMAVGPTVALGLAAIGAMQVAQQTKLANLGAMYTGLDHLTKEHQALGNAIDQMRLLLHSLDDPSPMAQRLPYGLVTSEYFVRQSAALESLVAALKKLSADPYLLHFADLMAQIVFRSGDTHTPCALGLMYAEKSPPDSYHYYENYLGELPRITKPLTRLVREMGENQRVVAEAVNSLRELAPYAVKYGRKQLTPDEILR